MASFAEAITANIVAGMSVDSQMNRVAVQQYIDGQKSDQIIQRATALDNIEKLLTAAKDRDAHPSVIAGYEKLISNLVAL